MLTSPRDCLKAPRADRSELSLAPLSAPRNPASSGSAAPAPHTPPAPHAAPAPRTAAAPAAPSVPASPVEAAVAMGAEEPRGCLYALSQPPLMLFLCVIGGLIGGGAVWDLLFL
ncbi:hypothetical protein VSR01_05295 [Actinacidiphila sp. DG2A-62]|uniref:hypothetical protein n=1 Tax=Actinacidiphila sp. DG2A-62 TaxID=3108821 RepID=UPI002DB8FBA0|nr:hypothetical protein [Actinacidiphila sp. DG2A-62]MEC3992990.1 hypothetical protein [Actinacidiphila sp. DG2A-62]